MADKKTKQEIIMYFKELAYEYEELAARELNDWDKVEFEAKAEAYELAAFEIEHNMEQAKKGKGNKFVRLCRGLRR